eukprot:GEMP01079337.1.p1 GENE.GEMP01079337.1~~GEMP01079337.1.p1  ORF type:complete len:211 (+),score=45.23 GEMP01079337.1:272-904(+)
MTTILRIKRRRDEEGPDSIVATQGKRLRIFRKLPASEVSEKASTLPARKLAPEKSRKRQRDGDFENNDARYREIGRQKTADNQAVVDVERVEYQSDILCNGRPMTASRSVTSATHQEVEFDKDTMSDEYDLYEQAANDLFASGEIPFCDLDRDDGSSVSSYDDLGLPKSRGNHGLYSDSPSTDSSIGWGTDSIGGDWEEHVQKNPWRELI